MLAGPRGKPRRAAWWWAALLGLAFFGIYAAMLPDQPTAANAGGDGGDFVAAMLTGGVPHPTGYPVYTMLGRLLTRLPVSTPYYRAALLSAASAGLAVALLCRWTWAMAGESASPRPWLAALAAGTAWGSSPIFWSQAVIVEVHALQAGFLLAWLGWITALLLWGRRPAPALALAGFALAAGISLGNHVTILLLLPVLGVSLLSAVRRGMPPRLMLAQAAAAFAGVLVYAYLPLAARGWPAVNWGNPQTWQGFWWLVSAEPYQGLVFTAGAGTWLLRAGDWAKQLLAQFGAAGLLLGALGLVRSNGLPAEIRLVLIWLFGMYSLFSIGYNTYDSHVYLIPALLAFAVWIGQGVNVVWPVSWRGWAVGRVVALGALALLAGRMAVNWRAADPREPASQAVFAGALLGEAPQGAFLITSGDADSFPLWYYHFGLGERPDVRVVVQPLTQFDWYQETLQRTYPDLRTPPLGSRTDGGWADLLVDLNPERPVCRSRVDPDDPAMAVYQCPVEQP